ncbi:MAG TPA: GPP34 family phosphoprotein [Actinospica sp.]|nr:GPP34 family phosphoprotein [Actinospica sp.]
MTLGADLVMLAVDEHQGTLSQTRQLAFALAGAELVDLARLRRIAATPEARVKVTESLGTGDPVLDATLHALSSSDDGLLLEDVVAIHLPDRIARQVTALLDAGELSGRAITTTLGGQPTYYGLRPADPLRRQKLIERLAAAAEWREDLALEAFGALVHITGLSSATLRRGQRRARRRLEDLARRFGETWRYLPGCPPELVLDRDDLAPGQVHPQQEQPWRLAVLLAVEEAGRRVAALPRPSQGGGGLDRDVANAANLNWALRHGA